MGSRDAAAADAGERHASREAVRVRMGLADAADGHSGQADPALDILLIETSGCWLVTEAPALLLKGHMKLRVRA